LLFYSQVATETCKAFWAFSIFWSREGVFVLDKNPFRQALGAFIAM